MVLDEHTVSSGIGMVFVLFLFAVGLVLISYLEIYIYILNYFQV